MGRPPKIQTNRGFGDDDQAASTVETIWSEGRRAMYDELERWVTNLLFYRGEQWSRTKGDLARYRWAGPDEDEDITRMTANVLKKHVLGWVARMTKHTPRYQVFPTTQDEDDKAQADIFNRVIPWRQRVMKFKSKKRRATLLTAIMGNAFLQSDWDALAGTWTADVGKLPEGLLSGMPGDNELLGDEKIAEYFEYSGGKNLKFGDLKRTGDVTCTVLPAYMVTPELAHVPDLDDQPGILISDIVTMAQVKELYSEPEFRDKLDGIKGGLDSAGEQLWFLQQMGVEFPETEGAEGNSEEDSGDLDARALTLRHTYWGRPCKSHQRGIRCVVIGGQTFENGDNPYMHGRLPVVHLKHSDDGVHFWARCDLDDAIEVQCELNKTISQMIDARDMTCNPMLLEKMANVNWNTTMAVPGQVIRVNHPNGEVKYLEPPGLPSYISQMVQEFLYLIETIFSDHKASQGVSKAGDSGVKTRWLQMADEARFVPFTEGLSDALRDFWLQQMSLILQYKDAEQIAYLVGQESEQQFKVFNRDNVLHKKMVPFEGIMEEDDALRAKIQALMERTDMEVSVVPGKSVATVREDIIALTQIGMLNPQTDRQVALEMMGYGFEVPQILSKQRKQAGQAWAENQMLIEQGQMPGPKPFQDHGKHVEVHADFSNSDEFDKLQPEQQQQLYQHIFMHHGEVARKPVQGRYIEEATMEDMMAKHGPLKSAMGGAPQNPQGPPKQAQNPEESKPPQRQQPPQAPGQGTPGQQ